MTTGAHAATVRVINDRYCQYLELQRGIAGVNGCPPFTPNTLHTRFGCEDGQHHEYSNNLIELDSLQNNTEFIDLLIQMNLHNGEELAYISDNKLEFAWSTKTDMVGERRFTFDGIQIFNLYRDSPHKPSPE